MDANLHEVNAHPQAEFADPLKEMGSVIISLLQCSTVSTMTLALNRLTSNSSGVMSRCSTEPFMSPTTGS